MEHRALLDHQFRVIAFAVTWAIQLAYLGWLAWQWRAQRGKGRPAGPRG